MQIRQYDKTVEDYTRYVKLHSKDSTMYTNRGFVYILLYRYDLAIDDFNKAIELDTRNALAYGGRARAYHFQDKKAEAEEDYLKHISLETSTSIPFFSLGILYWQENRQQEAKIYFQRGLPIAEKEAQASVYSQLYIAISHLGLGDTEKGLEEYQRFIDTNAETNVDAHIESLKLLKDAPIPLAGVEEALKILRKESKAK